MDAEQDVTDVETIVAEDNSLQTDSGIASEESSNTSDSSYQTALDASDLSSLEDSVENLNLTDEEEGDGQGKDEIVDIQLDHAMQSRVQVVVERDGDEDITLNMDKTATVNEVLHQASMLGDFACTDYELSMGGKNLPRAVTLRDAAIPYGSRLRLVERTFQIFIRRVDGRITTMDVRASSTVQYLKEQFNYTDQVPVHQQRLLFQSRELENTRTLQYYKIRSGSTLEMVYRLRGGDA